MIATSSTRPRPAGIAVLLALISALPGCGAMLGAGLVTDSSGATSSAVSYMNEARQANGLGAASPDSKLEQAALEQARYMAAAGEMTHTTRRGRDFVSRKEENDIEGTAA